MKEIDLKKIWQNQKITTPADASSIVSKAKTLQSKMRIKIILGNILLLATMFFIIAIVAYFQPRMLTTKIGTLLVVIALVMQIGASSKLLPLLNKNNADQSNSEYLQKLMVLKKKQFFLETTILSLYFVLLGMGLALYMIEYAMKLSVYMMLLYYGITALWMAFAWFYLRPRTIRKQRQRLDEVIGQLEDLESQFQNDL